MRELLDNIKKCTNNYSKCVKKFINWLLVDVIKHAIVVPVFALLIYVFQWSTNSAWKLMPLLSYFETHPYRTIFSLLIFSLLLHAGYRLFWIAKSCIGRRRLVDSVGLFSFWKHHTDEDRQADWQVCVDKIKEASTLKILGATGWETFAEDGSPLHKAVLSFPGEIKVLLMSPEAECLEKRVSSLGDVSKSDYIAQINKTIDFCKLLRKKSIKIHLKLYDQHPIWKMVIADGFLWLQHYRDRTHVDQTPVYGVYANKEETSLYYPLSEVFYKRWELDNNTEINLDG